MAERDGEDLPRADAARRERRKPTPPEIPEVLRCTGDAAERLRRIEDGDTLEIAARTQRRLRAECLFLEPERLILRAMARTAILAPKYEGTPPLDEWLDKIVVLAIEDLLREQEHEEDRGLDVMDSLDRNFYLRFSVIAKIPSRHGRLACLVMNQLPPEDRRTFFAVIVEGKGINRWVAEGNGPPQRIQRSLRNTGLKVLGAIERAERRHRDGGTTDER
jgi:hypothetical protein